MPNRRPKIELQRIAATGSVAGNAGSRTRSAAEIVVQWGSVLERKIARERGIVGSWSAKVFIGSSFRRTSFVGKFMLSCEDKYWPYPLSVAQADGVV